MHIRVLPEYFFSKSVVFKVDFERNCLAEHEYINIYHLPGLRPCYGPGGSRVSRT